LTVHRPTGAVVILDGRIDDQTIRQSAVVHRYHFTATVRYTECFGSVDFLLAVEKTYYPIEIFTLTIKSKLLGELFGFFNGTIGDVTAKTQFGCYRRVCSAESGKAFGVFRPIEITFPIGGDRGEIHVAQVPVNAHGITVNLAISEADFVVSSGPGIAGPAKRSVDR